MGRKPEDYARLLTSALCKLHAEECRRASPLVSENSLRVITETIAIAMEDARREHFQQALAVMRERSDHILLHS